MSGRKVLMAGVVAGSVAVGAVAGAVVFTPGVGLAGSGSNGDAEIVARCGGLLGSGPIVAAADVLGVEPRELLLELRDGATVAEVAEDHGVERSTVVDAMEAALRERLEMAVENGWLTQEQADAREDELREHAEAFVDGELAPFPFPRPWHWRGGIGPPWHDWSERPGSGIAGSSL